MVFFFINWCLLVVALGISNLMTTRLGIGFHIQIGSTKEILKIFFSAAILSLLYSTLGRILKVFLFPISCLTFGSSSLLINGLLLYFVNLLDLGIRVDSFLACILASFFISLNHSILKHIARLALK